MKRKGFTLVELLVAIALIGIIGITLMPSVMRGLDTVMATRKFTVDSFSTQEVAEKELNEFLKAKYSSGIDVAAETVEGLEEVTVSLFGKDVKGFTKSYDITKRDDNGTVITEESGLYGEGAKHGVISVFFTAEKIPMLPVPVIGEPTIEARIIVENSSTEFLGKSNGTSSAIEDEGATTKADMMNLIFVGKEADDSTKEDVAVVIYKWYSVDLDELRRPKMNTLDLIKEWNPTAEDVEFHRNSSSIVKRQDKDKDNGKLLPKYTFYPAANVEPRAIQLLSMSGGYRGDDFLRIADLNGVSTRVLTESDTNDTSGDIFNFTTPQTVPIYEDEEIVLGDAYSPSNLEDQKLFYDYFDFNSKGIAFSTTPISKYGSYGQEKFTFYISIPVEEEELPEDPSDSEDPEDPIDPDDPESPEVEPPKGSFIKIDGKYLTAGQSKVELTVDSAGGNMSSWILEPAGYGTYYIYSEGINGKHKYLTNLNDNHLHLKDKSMADRYRLTPDGFTTIENMDQARKYLYMMKEKNGKDTEIGLTYNTDEDLITFEVFAATNQ